MRSRQSFCNPAALPEIDPLSAEDEPDDAFISVRYREKWFYIDDRDYQSKRMFSFLLLLFTLTESGDARKAPILTIPTG